MPYRAVVIGATGAVGGALVHELIRVEDLARAMRVNAERPAAPGIEILEYPDFMGLLRES